MGRKSKTTGKRITKQSKLGRSLMKAKKQQRLVKVGNARCSEMHITDIQDSNEGKLQSVLERNDLEEFLATAQMADREFKAERRVYIKNGEEDTKIVDQKSVISKKRFEPETFEQMRIPKRPKWESLGLTKEQLDRQEKDSFLNWRRELAQTEQSSSNVITPFEKNLEVWRQLWRVVERSDIVVQIVDARNPLLFRCDDLDDYVSEISRRQGRKKRHILCVNKADYLSEFARKTWKKYFDAHKIDFVFWSAYNATKEIEAKTQKAKDAKKAGISDLSNVLHSESSDVDKKTTQIEKTETSYVEPDVKGSDHRVLSRSEILQYFESLGRKVIKDSAFSNDEEKSKEKKTELEKNPMVTVGMIGYPNVGKSSTVNVLMGEKRVSVSATPGKTKHFQTLMVRDGLQLCDCPGLVFPTFMRTKSALVTSGVYPIAQLRDYVSPVGDVCARVTREQLSKLYGLVFPRTKPVTAATLLNAHARMRGFMKDHGRPDTSRSARVILSDYVNGKLLYCHPPPHLPQKHNYVFLLSIQGSTENLDLKLAMNPPLKKTNRKNPAKPREVWGVPVKEGIPEDIKSIQKDVEGPVETKETEESALPASVLAAGDVDAKTQGLLEEDELLQAVLDEDEQVDSTNSFKPNTNKKMSKRERRRLRKLNKMNNMMRRQTGLNMKRAARNKSAPEGKQVLPVPFASGLPAVQSSKGTVVAVTWGGETQKNDVDE
eukprot:CAMPEP_0167770806 /NCGR_PEP_ID=MMETSP0110_2-20121227/18141_1 /TAXON_ID=629695 /ORGANISM="Gymnochlora sp., Strain CCMP2014" /LENGTH=715 /DNA_ID=CAMNT_0007660059 /DNA_START=186 /DNA_END=2333 /DNA_ORIENTATION=-